LASAASTREGTETTVKEAAIVDIKKILDFMGLILSAA
jgi:hypothetical protein